MRAVTMFAIALGLILGLTGCGPTLASAHVECGKLQHVSGDYGYSNAAGFGLGMVRRFVKGTDITANDENLGAPASPTSVSLPDSKQTVDQDVTIELSANIPATVKAEVKSAIKNSMKLEVKGDVSRSEIPSYIQAVNADAKVRDSVLKALEQPDTKVFLVFAVILAKETHFSLVNSAGGSASANVLNIGDFKVAVEYKCSDSLDRTSDTAKPMFFKVVWLKKGADGNVIQDDSSASIDLSNARWTGSFQ